jgi:DNA-directed RNA polymerase alpha subunit
VFYRRIAEEIGISKDRVGQVEAMALRKLANAISALLAKAAILAKPFEEQSAAALDIRVDELGLSERSANCLKYDHIVTVRDLVQKTDGEMLRLPNFGRKSLAEIRAVLGELGLSLRKTVREA